MRLLTAEEWVAYFNSLPDDHENLQRVIVAAQRNAWEAAVRRKDVDELEFPWRAQ